MNLKKLKKLKKFKRVRTLILAMILLAVSVAPVMAEQPQGYWPYYSAYSDAVNSGNVDEIMRTGDEMLNFYSSFEMNRDMAEVSYNIYLYRFENEIYEKRGDYEGAKQNMEKLIYFSEYLGFTDMITRASAKMEKLDPMTEVYGLTSQPANYPVYGVRNEPARGTYYGRVADMNDINVMNASAIDNEAIVSFYVEAETESADDFAWNIGNYDTGEHILHIALNFTYEEVTAQNIVNGALDQNIADTLSYIATLKSPVFLRIGAEMNVWENMDPQLFKQAYTRVAQMARSTAPNAVLVFSVNYTSFWGADMLDYYPGDEYVDWVGVSLYMDYPQESGDEAMDTVFGRGRYNDCVLSLKEVVEKFGDRKPVLMAEGGSSYKIDANHSAEQVRKMYSVLNMIYPQLKAMIYFDTNDDTDFYVLADNAAVNSAYQEAVAGNPALLNTVGDSAERVYMPLNDQFLDKSATLDLAAYSDTIMSDYMTVNYYMDGVQLPGSAQVPYNCSVNTADISEGTHTLRVTFDDGAGYTAEKNYTLTKLSDGTVTVKVGAAVQPPVDPVDPVDQPSPGSDTPSDWAAEEVAAAVGLGLVAEEFRSGYTDSITRLDFCRLVIDLIEVKSGMNIDDFLAEKGFSKESAAFTDTSEDDVLAACALQIVSGRGDGIFDPSASITRQEAAKMLTVTAQILGMAAPEGDIVPAEFTDSAEFAEWAKEYVDFISCVSDKETGRVVMGGVGDGRFDYAGSYTREQTYLTMLRLYRAF